MSLKNGMNVNIYLKTKVIQGEAIEEFLFELVGQVVRVGHHLYIRYQEPQEDGVTFVPVTVKISPDESVQLTRVTDSRLRFKFQYQEMILYFLKLIQYNRLCFFPHYVRQ